jgi:hypothetical protein
MGWGRIEVFDIDVVAVAETSDGWGMSALSDVRIPAWIRLNSQSQQGKANPYQGYQAAFNDNSLWPLKSH